MDKSEEVAFCKKRIQEQNKYIEETTSKAMDPFRRTELINSAKGVRKNFRQRLVELVGLAGYVHFKLFEE